MLPKISQLLYLQINSIDDEEAKQEFKSRISDIRDTYMFIEVPMNERTGRLKRLYVGDELSVYFITEGGFKNYFTTSVLGFREDVIHQVVIKKPDLESITKVQRRNFLRVPAELEISVSASDSNKFLAVTEDVSGGGISFLCEKDTSIQQNAQISCWLLLNYKNGKVDHIAFKGEVVRIKPLEIKKLCMVQFAEITDRDRQKIIRYCFERQIDFRKN